jgi:hypothetical protein
MLRVIVGLIKGLIIGGGVGYGLIVLAWPSTLLAYLACAAVGAIVGVVAGRAPWRAETIWTPVIKMIVGALIGVGLCALGLKVVPDATFHFLKPLGPSFAEMHLHSGPVLAALVGVLYGVFVEVDDGGAKKPAAPASSS